MTTSHELPSERLIICHTLFHKNQSEQFGFVQPIAEISGGQLVEISKDEFCSTMRVFITSHYDDLEKSFPDRKLFMLKIKFSDRPSENVAPEYACKYVASFSDATALKQKDFFEIVQAELPDANNRLVVPEDLPGTSYIFIDDGQFIYGPFKWSKVSKDDSSCIEIDFLDTPLPNVKLMQYQTYKIDSARATKHLIGNPISTRYFTQGISGLLSCAEYIDYASDDEVIRYCAKMAGDQGSRIIERSRLEALAATIRKFPKLDNEFNRSRLNRMVSIADVSSSVQEEVAKSLTIFLQGTGSPIVQRFIEMNEALFIERIRKERADQINRQLADLSVEVSKAEVRLVELNAQKNLLNEDIQALKAERDRGADLQQVYAESDEIIKKKNAEIADIDSKIRELAVVHNLTQNIDKLKDEVKYYERKRDDEKDRQEQAREVTKELDARMQESNSGLQKRIAELKPFVEALNGSFTSAEPITEFILAPTKELSQSKSLLSRQNEVIQAIQNGLTARGRYLKSHQIANLLITLQQSFITIFAGLPGVGKTSLARLISDTQNIKPRLREIAVSRGWTSQKDLIGYFNPLTSRFQAASTGLYSFLIAIGEEAERDPSRAMSFVLLDEANLSPIEHYWSAFMGLSDNEGDKEVILGAEKIKIPDNLRFIATINYDGTTEPLSPRLINRAPILVLDSMSENADLQPLRDLSETVLPIPASQMKELFGLVAKTPELSADERPVYEAIKRILLDSDPIFGRPVAISPRKENAIQQYCAKARALMNVDNDLLALDFAVQQHILPLIQGNGARFGKRLDKLRAELLSHDLSESERFLSKMITFGEADLQTYDFFCW